MKTEVINIRVTPEELKEWSWRGNRSEFIRDAVEEKIRCINMVNKEALDRDLKELHMGTLIINN